jgi:hypothetical protein
MRDGHVNNDAAFFRSAAGLRRGTYKQFELGEFAGLFRTGPMSINDGSFLLPVVPQARKAGSSTRAQAVGW